MAVGIAVTATDNTALRATFSLTGLDTAKRYDVLRVISGSDDNERRYQVIGSYRDWKPSAATATVVDYEAPIRPYRVAIWDSTLSTPLDFDFSLGGYTGPAALVTSNEVKLTSPLCGAVIRSTKTPGLYVDVRIWDLDPVLYRARVSELTPMGTRFPVIIADRREGRRVERLVVYTSSVAAGKALTDLLIPETGRIHPVWLRTDDTNKLLFHDLLMMPLDITVEPASKANPERRFFTIAGVEVDPRLMPGGVI